jgi:FMN-dependent NADH-azoreductase
MTTLLHIESSAAGPESISRSVAGLVRAEWPGDVIYRDLSADPVPLINAEQVIARRTEPEALTPELKAATLVQDELIEEFLAADAYLVAVPLYNYSVPAAFKAWIDQIVVLGKTLAFPGTPPPTAGRPAIVVSARGGAYGQDTPGSGKDFALPWLQLILGETLGLEVQFITPENALAATHPRMAALIPAYEESLRAAREQARVHSHTLGARLIA